MKNFTFITWVAWAILLIAQNFAFTFVSRARNSGSLKRHMMASVMSNGIWFLSQTIIFSQMFNIMTGRYGLPLAIFTGLYYTCWTMGGAMLGHAISLRTEKGKGAVGANKKYAQIRVEEWETLKAELAQLKEASGGAITTLD